MTNDRPSIETERWGREQRIVLQFYLWAEVGSTTQPLKQTWLHLFFISALRIGKNLIGFKQQMFTSLEFHIVSQKPEEFHWESV